MKTKDKYGEAKVITSPRATSRVYSPILSDEERARRVGQIKEAATRLIAATDLTKKKEKTSA